MTIALDPQAASLVAYLKKLGMPAFSAQDPAETRRLMAESRRPVKVEDVAEVLDLADQFSGAAVTADDGDADEARGRWRAPAQQAAQEFADD